MRARDNLWIWLTFPFDWSFRLLLLVLLVISTALAVITPIITRGRVEQRQRGRSNLASAQKWLAHNGRRIGFFLDAFLDEEELEAGSRKQEAGSKTFFRRFFFHFFFFGFGTYPPNKIIDNKTGQLISYIRSHF